MNKKERVICKFDVDFKKSFCWSSSLSNDDNNNIIIVFSTDARSNNQGGKWHFLVWNRNLHVTLSFLQEVNKKFKKMEIDIK